MNEIVEFPPFSKNHLAHWKTNKKSPVETVALSDKSIEELTKFADRTSDETFTAIPVDSFKACLDTVAEIRNKLEVSGAVIVDRIPIKCTEISIYRRAAGILSNLVSPLMAQDIKGTLLYDVIDEGAKSAGTIRRSKTNEAQPFHTDGPWHHVIPSTIGLFCIKPAEQGGYSQVSSLQSAVQDLIDTNPSAVETLQDLYQWNCMGQFKEGQKPFNELPVIERVGDKTLIRHYVDYVKTGHELASIKLRDNARKMFERIESSLASHACEPFKLEAGQMQFVNNWAVAHARAGFDDQTEQSGRHLVRLWNTQRSN